jgi:hypothetical protein
MSKLNVEIQNLDSLRRACDRLGIALDMNDHNIRYYGGTQTYDGKIIVPGSNYDIGIKVLPDGSIEMHGDLYGSSGDIIRKACGNDFSDLKQMYTVEETKRLAMINSYNIVSEVETDEDIELTIEVD